MKIKRTLGEGLVAFREELGMSRKEFYEKVGISKHRLSQIENDKNTNSERSITSILEHFNISFQEFAIEYCGFTPKPILSNEQIHALKDTLTLDDLDDAIQTLNIIRQIIKTQK